MSREEYEAFKVLWRAETFYLQETEGKRSCLDYINELNTQRKLAREHSKTARHEIKDADDKLLREISWLEQNKETIDTVHLAMKRISQTRKKYKPLQNAFECACLFLSGDPFFRSPVSPNIRPHEMPYDEPRVIPISDLHSLSIGTNIAHKVVIQDLYRGSSSNTYSNVSPILRTPSDKDTITKRWEKLMSFRDYIREKHEDKQIFELKNKFNDLLALAYMQHFKRDAGLSPSMLDLTYDPFVALFFATLSANKGRIGVVYRFSLNADFDEFSTFSSLGKLRVIALPGIHRLRRQRALLLFGPSGDVLDQLMPFRCEFLQHENLTFEDKELGITNENLLNDDQDNVNFCERFEEWREQYKSNAIEASKSLEPPTLYLQPEELYKDVIAWLSENTDCDPSSKRLSKEIYKLVEFHSKLEQNPSIRPGTYSIRNLTEAARHFANGAKYLRAIGTYLFSRERAIVKRVMQAATETWSESVGSDY